MRFIHLNEYQANRGSILFLNGGGQIHISKYHKLTRYFSNKPYNLISVELPGHGKSRFERTVDETEFIDHFKQQFTSLITKNNIKVSIIFGFSLGGLLTLKAIEMQLFVIEKAIVYGCGFGVNKPEVPTFEYYTSEQFFIDQNWLPIMLKNHGSGWKNLLLSLHHFLSPESKIFTTPSKMKGTDVLMILGDNEEIFNFDYNYNLCKNTDVIVKSISGVSHFEYMTKGWDQFENILKEKLN